MHKGFALTVSWKSCLNEASCDKMDILSGDALRASDIKEIIREKRRLYVICNRLKVSQLLRQPKKDVKIN